jgi:hypothetical protein
MRQVATTLIVIAGLCGCGSSKPLPEVSAETSEKQESPTTQEQATAVHFERKPLASAELSGKWTGQHGEVRIELEFARNGEVDWAISYPIRSSDGIGSSRGRIGASLNLADDLDSGIVNLVFHSRAEPTGTNFAYLEGDGESIYLTVR